MQPIMKFKNIITPSKVEWADFEINHYIGCTNNCSYCADKAIAARFFGFKAWTKPVLKFDPQVAIEKLGLELAKLARRKRQKPKRTRIILSFMTDPFQPIERKYQLTAAILEELANWEFQIWVLTKSTPRHCHSNDVDYYELMSAVPNLHYGITINSLKFDEKREPNAPSPSLRLDSIFKAKKGYGIKIFESLEPTYEKSVLPVVQHPISLQCCDFFILGKLNPSDRYNNDYLRYMPQVIQFLKENNKKFLVKEELRAVLGISDEKPEVKQPKNTLERFFQ